MDRQHNFSVLDYIIFFATVALSLGIGVFFACRKTKTHATIVDYFLAGRKMSVIPAAMSLVVTYQSSLMIIGNPAEVYSYGLMYAYFVIGGVIAYVFAAFTVVPIFHPLKLTSVNTYFYLRYQDNLVRYLVLIFGLGYYIFYMAAVTYGTCVALEVIIGIPQWGTIIIYTIVTAIYTSIGGMKAVIWTDVLQLIIMMTGVLAILTKCILDVGGMTNMLELASNRLDMSDFRFDPRIRYQFWNTVFGSIFIFLVGCYQQPGIQRVNSIPDVPTARRLFAIAGPLYAFFAFIICSEGVAIYAYYAFKRCDPLASGRILSRNGIVPLAVSDLFSSIPGLSGLFIASLSSAVLSTLSSCLSSLGAVTYDDIIKVNFPNIPENKATLIAKIVVFLYGLLAMSCTFLVSVLPGSIIAVAISLMGCLDGPTCGVFLVSTMYRRATGKGVTCGALVAVAFIFWMNMGKMFGGIDVTAPLPPAPVDKCPVLHRNNQDFFDYSTNLYVSTMSLNTSTSSLTTTSSLQNSTDLLSKKSSHLQNFYSVSFMGYACYGFVITVVLSVIFSKLTRPKDTDEKYLFSFNRHIYEPLFGKEKQSEKNEKEIPVEMEPMYKVE